MKKFAGLRTLVAGEGENTIIHGKNSHLGIFHGNTETVVDTNIDHHFRAWLCFGCFGLDFY